MRKGFLSPRFLSGLVIGAIVLMGALTWFNAPERGRATDRWLESLGLPPLGAHEDSSERERPDWWEDTNDPYAKNNKKDTGKKHDKNASQSRRGGETVSLPDDIANITQRDLRDLPRGTDITINTLREDYDRKKQFGEWADPDGNKCDARNDILARDLTQVKKKGKCTVTSGVLNDPYTGTTIRFTRGAKTSTAVQIDHIVPLAHAWTNSANTWSQDKRVQFANDPNNLIASDGPANVAKGARVANEWMPPNKNYHCDYAKRTIYVKKHYGLTVGNSERRALNTALRTCKSR